MENDLIIDKIDGDYLVSHPKGSFLLSAVIILHRPSSAFIAVHFTGGAVLYLEEHSDENWNALWSTFQGWKLEKTK